MKDIRISALLLIPYLTICGTLYHVAYWGKFNLNGLMLISASDIVKYATLPILPSFLLAAIQMFFWQYVFRMDTLYPPAPAPGNKPRIENFKHHKLLTSGLLLTWAAMSVLLYVIDLNTIRWTAWAYLTSVPIPIFLARNGFLERQIANDKFRMITVTLLVLLPLLAFARGKEDSEYIYKNEGYQYILPHSEKTDTLKYLGMTQEKIVFTDMRNSRIIILSASNDTLVLYKK